MAGQFGPAQILLPPQEFPKLHALNMDGDGDIDLVGHFDGQHFMWADNTDGLGTLSAFNTLLTTGPVSMYKVSDLNDDGLQDIIYVNGSDELFIAMNLGGGSFGTPASVQQLSGPVGALAVADISGNGSPDILVTITQGEVARIAYFLNESGTFGPQFMLPPQFTGPPPSVLLVGDLDGVPGGDVLAINEQNAAVGIMNINGDGSEWQEQILFHLFDYTFVDPMFLDVDGDGDLDVAEASSIVVQWAENRIDEALPFNAFTVRVIEPFFTAGMGTFGNLSCGPGASVVFVPSNPDMPVRWSTFLPSTDRFSPRQDLAGIPRGSTLVMADMNGDGKKDLLIGNADGLQLFVNMIQPPTTDVILPALDTVCVAGPSISLPDAIPAGGTWSGTWVMNNVFHRSSVGGTATVPLSYTWYEPEGCPVGESTTMRVISGPVIMPFFAQVVCSGEGPFQMTSQPADVQWTGLSEGNVLDLAQYNGEQIIAAFTDHTGSTCVSFMGPLTIWNSVPASITPAGPFCVNDGPQTIVADLEWANNQWSGDTTGIAGPNAIFDPAVGAGSYTIILHRTPIAPLQCANTDSITITVSDDIPEVSVIQPPAYCASTEEIALDFAEPPGGDWVGAGVIGDTLLPALAGPGDHVLTYTINDPGGCSNSAQITLTLAASVTIEHSAGSTLSFCVDDDPITFTAHPIGGEWSDPVAPDGFFDPAVSGVGEYPLFYVYTDPNGCMLVNAPAMISVNDEPAEVSIDSVSTVCLTDPPFPITGSLPGIWSGAVTGIGDTLIFDPAQLGPGTWTVILTAELDGYCPGVATMDVVVEICTALNEDHSGVPMSTAPNPTTGICTVRLNVAGPKRLTLRDGSGRMISEMSLKPSGTDRIQIDLADLANGIYHLELHHGGQVERTKVVKSE